MMEETIDLKTSHQYSYENKIVTTSNIDLDKITIMKGRRQIDENSVTSLAKSIIEIGLINPITVSNNGKEYILISGAHRLAAVKKLGWSKIDARIVTLDNIRAEIAEIDENIVRHNLPELDECDALARRKELYLVLHPETKAVVGKELVEKRWDTRVENTPVSFVKDIAAKTNLSESTIKQKVQISNNIAEPVKDTIREKLPELSDNKNELLKIARMNPEKQAIIVEKIINGSAKDVYTATVAANRDIRMKEIRAIEPEKLEDDKAIYNVILADPPWLYDQPFAKGRWVGNHYPMLDSEKIKNLIIPIENDAILFLWAIAPKIQDALDVIEAWGFHYKTQAVWDKEIIGLGDYFRGQHELLLVATRGNWPTPAPENRPSSVIRSQRTGHSEKPIIIYDIIEKMYPGMRYIELFARNERPGWKSWGNEVDNVNI